MVAVRKSLEEKKVVAEVRYVPNRQFLNIPFAGGAIPEPS